MKRIIVCVEAELVDNYLAVGMASDTLVIHHDPHVCFDSESGVYANFDFYVDTGFSKRLTADVIELLGQRYINAQRIPKRRQLMLARRLGLNTPKFGFIPQLDAAHTSTSQQCALIRRMGFGPGDRILIKGDNAARGMAQVVVRYEDFHQFAGAFLKQSGARLTGGDPLYELGGSDSDSEDPCHVEAFREAGAHYTFNELIDVRSEYRILFNCVGGRIVATRQLKAKAGYQAGFERGRLIAPTEIFPVAFMARLDTLIEATGLPFGSIDVYLDDKGRWGIFEYSPEFGYAKPHTIDETITLMVQGLHHMIQRRASALTSQTFRSMPSGIQTARTTDYTGAAAWAELVLQPRSS